MTIKLRPVPPVRKYASFVFADFETGFRFMRQVCSLFLGSFQAQSTRPSSVHSRASFYACYISLCKSTLGKVFSTVFTNVG